MCYMHLQNQVNFDQNRFWSKSTWLLKDWLNRSRIKSIVEGWIQIRQNQIESILLHWVVLFVLFDWVNFADNRVERDTNQVDFITLSRFCGANWVDFRNRVNSEHNRILETHITHFWIDNFETHCLLYYRALKNSLLKRFSFEHATRNAKC